jgi:ABC-type microcin C transport system permease subunit YejB
MFAFFIRRLVTLVPTLVFVSMLIFGLQQLLPGDSAQILAGEDQNPELIAQLRLKLHLDEPLPVQYGYWMAGVLQGDLGESARTQQPVLELLLQKLPVTLELALLSMLIALLIGLPAGVISAVKRGTVWDHGATVLGLSGLSMPNFWLGILMILLFSVELGWLPASGYVSPFENLKDNLLLQGIALSDMPHVLQYNKRDLPNAAAVADLDAALNPGWAVTDPARQKPTPDPNRPGEYLVREVDGTWVERVPTYEAVAVRGDGVFDTLKAVSKQVLKTLG